MTDTWLDLRRAVRLHSKNKGFTAVVLLLLALSIGVNTAVFSVLDAVVIRPLPFPAAARLVTMWESNPKKGLEKVPVMEGAFSILKLESQSIEDMTAFVPPTSDDSEGPQEMLWDSSEPITQVVCTSDLFDLLGIQPILGRTFLPSDERWGASRAVVLSYRLWQERYKGSAEVIGQTLALNRLGFKFEYTIVGVMPERFVFPFPLFPKKPDAWVAYRYPPGGPTGVNGLWAMGRLKPGVTLAQARSEMQTIADRIAKTYPRRYGGERLTLVPLAEEIAAEVHTTLLVLFGAVSLLLLIACANIGNMLLSRGAQREYEVAIRVAMGASRITLLRQMLTETVVLCVAGGVLGTLLAVWIRRVLVTLVPAGLYVPRLNEVTIDWRVLGYAVLVSAFAALLCGVLPSLRVSHHDLAAVLRSGKALSRGRRSSLFQRPGSVLLVSELALALLLLVGSFLLIRSLQVLLSVNQTFEPRNLFSMSFMLSNAAKELGQEQQALLYHEFLERAAGLPGIKAVALASDFPPGSGSMRQFKATSGGGPISQDFLPAETHSVTRELFDIMGMTLLRGRLFGPTDRIGAMRVAVINEVMAQSFWPHGNPLGVQIQMGAGQTINPNYFTIVGIVREGRRLGAGASSSPAVYLPMEQLPLRGSVIVARTVGDPRSVVSSMREAAQTILPRETIVYGVRTGETIVAQSTSRLRFGAALLGTFAAIALVLAAMGVYGLISYFTTLRTREIGLRIAVGAQQKDVLRLIMGQGLRLALAGVTIGAVAALALTRVMRTLLFEVKPTDPLTFGGVAVLLVLITLAACYIPARRATRVDPMVALRHE